MLFAIGELHVYKVNKIGPNFSVTILQMHRLKYKAESWFLKKWRMISNTLPLWHNVALCGD